MITHADILGARILVVDDQPVNVQLLEILLKASGYRNVDSTTDPRQAALLHAQHRYDLVILDLNMPGMDGFEVMEALKPVEDGAWLPVLVVTADPDKSVEALAAGARDFVGKPFDNIEVLTRIRNLVEMRLLLRESAGTGAMLERTVRERTAELQRFRSAMDATSDAIFLIDAAAMQLVDASDGACRMLGYSRDELLGSDPAAFGLASHAQMELHADPARGEGLRAELVETELTGSDMVVVPTEVRWQLESADGRPMLIAVARDITERRIAQQHMKHLASYDSLTGLPNRVLFHQTLHDTIEMARDKGGRVAVLSIGLDRFKLVNDSMGASHGDELLRQFGNRLVQCLHTRDTLGRLAGDEFALILPMGRGQDDAVHVANEVREALRAPFELDGQQPLLTASIGIAMYPDDATDPQTLIKYADTAMGRAKAAGRDGYRFFTAGMNVQVIARLDLELALRRALDNDEFELYYQPKMNVNTGRITGVEALLRWHRPGYGMVFPAEFVPVLEETGLIVRIGAWIIDAACRQIAAWLAGGVGEVRVAVNVSSRQFVEGDLEAEICGSLARHKVDAALLELELTESALMDNAEHTSAVLTRLRDLGIRISIDDFGTGYSSLAYLKRFPIDKLKIDIAFVRDITTNPDDAAIALAIISMAHSMHMQVIAEGVESRAQLMYLRRHRCDQVQGFHVSRALTARQMGEMVLENRKAPPDAEGEAGTEQPTMLIVDDDINVLSALHRLFRRDNYKILTAVSPAEGFEQLAQHQVQVILCDQRMPFMSGTEFLSRVKEMYPDTVRIILSANTRVKAVIDSINSGAVYRFYTKPWDDTQLRDNIRLAFHHYWLVNGARDDPRRAHFITQDEEAEGMRVSRR